MFSWIIDVIAKRYGWTSQYIAEQLYWEELWEMVQLAANYDSVEKNEYYNLLFNLHADSKSKWKDLPIPFPIKTGGLEGSIPKNTIDPTGIKQLPKHFKVGRVKK